MPFPQARLGQRTCGFCNLYVNVITQLRGTNLLPSKYKGAMNAVLPDAVPDNHRTIDVMLCVLGGGEAKGHH